MSSDNVICDFNEDFKLATLKCNMNSSQIDEMLKLFNKHKIGSLPLSSRTMLKTPRNINIKQISNMYYYHFNIRNCIINNLSVNYPHFNGDVINISMNIDGIPLFNSSKKSLWPILLSLNIKPDTVFVVTLTHSIGNNTKPTNHDYLKECLSELKDLENNGILYNNIIIKINISAVICDSPARSMVKDVIGHSGFYSCDRCIQKGIRLDNRIVFLELNSKKRTNSSFRSQLHEEHHKGKSLFEDLNIDMITNFPIDYMHCACLGMMKKLLFIWLGKDKFFKCKKYRISSILEMDSRIEYIKKIIDSDIFNRKLRPVSCIAYWKATEFRLFLLYIGTIILKDLLPREYLEHFRVLQIATLLEKIQCLLKYRKLFFHNVENSLFKNSFLSTNTAKYSTKEYSIS